MSTIEPSAQVTFLADDEGRVVTWNPACASLFGWTLEQAPGRRLDDLIVAGAGWPTLAAAGGARVRMRFAGGHEGPASLSLLRQYDAHGEPQGWSAGIVVAPGESVSETERVGNTPLAQVVDLLPGTFYAINRQGRFILWNHNLERLTEMTPDELAAAQVMDLLEPVSYTHLRAHET